MNRIDSKIKFVGLHAHSVAGSIFDANGYPQDHMDFAYENGCDALALTDHGNMNGLAYQVLHAKKMQEAGKDFKPIFGCEAYFTPSIEEWHEAYNQAMEDKKKARAIKKDAQSGATVEDEGDSKKTQGILKRRRHLVLLAQNQTGLNNLFKLVSESYQPENFYRTPHRLHYSRSTMRASLLLLLVLVGCMPETTGRTERMVMKPCSPCVKQQHGGHFW